MIVNSQAVKGGVLAVVNAANHGYVFSGGGGEEGVKQNIGVTRGQGTLIWVSYPSFSLPGDGSGLGQNAYVFFVENVLIDNGIRTTVLLLLLTVYQR